MAYRQLGQILVSAGEIDEATLQAALEQGKREGKRLGEVLISNGTLTERQIIDCLKLQLGVDFIDLTKVKIPVSLAELVPKNIARTYNVVPVKTDGAVLYLAMTDPLNFKGIEAVRRSSKKRVIPMIATKTAMERAISTLYGNESVNKAIDDLEQSMKTTSMGISEETPEVETTDDNSQAAPAIRLVNSILERGASNGSSDIHIEPRSEGLTIRMRVDGVLHEILTVPKNLQNSVISRIKIMVDMDISEKRIPHEEKICR